MQSDTKTETIFVSIASYRDTECPATLADLFAKAAHPERVFAGVLWQVAPEDGDEYVLVPSNHANVRGLRVNWEDSRGACWARGKVQAELFAGEDYYLQVDSHSRFDVDWDIKLIKMLQSCPSPKAVISAHPNKYTPPDDLIVMGFPYLRARHFDDNRMLAINGRYFDKNRPLSAPIPNAFIGGGFVFGPGSMVVDVPYDPFLYFTGEEINMAVRLWTYGYDLYSPNDVIVYHDYTNERKRPRHWDDHKKEWVKLHEMARARLQHLLNIRICKDPEIIKDLDRYGLGVVRSLREYETFANLDLARCWLGVRSLDGCFPKAPPTIGAVAEIRKRFSEIYTDNQWQCLETRSGSGSTLKSTESLRTDLQSMLQQLKVGILVDAGCGDLHWMSKLVSTLDVYLGFDVVDDMIANNRTMYGEHKNCFFNSGDFSHDILPRADAILCRNAMTHLPNQLISQTMRNFKRSGSRYLIATTFSDVENKDAKIGSWRRINLTAPPFSLPEPMELIQDGEGNIQRFLGVWRLADC